MNVSLCVVAYNESTMLGGLLDEVHKQDYPHKQMEVVLIDSGSQDDTKEMMLEFSGKYKEEFLDVQVLDNAKRIQAAGWNVAIENFKTDVMIRVDAHGSIPPEFVRKNVENLQSGEDISGGVRPSIIANPTAWGQVLLQAESSMFGSSVASYRREGGEKTYVKSFFHGAYRRKVLEDVGGFHEYLGRTEDNEFHYRIRERGYRLCMDPSILSYQYARPKFGKMLKQKFGNGYWIGLTLGVCPKCLSIFHFVPMGFVFGIIFTTILAIFGWPLLGIIMWSAYGILAVMMSIITFITSDKHVAQILLPFLFLCLHVTYGVGTWIGLIRMPFWRRKIR